MLLSIGMIVKNEEKTLESCLQALQPIFRSIDSELIIADTGSTDNTVNIAKKYTDNVFSFEWINDFSAARNSTLEKAKGKWYMYIDADEIMQSCTDIINFFDSGEYKDYNIATIIIRNYTDYGQYDSFVDFDAVRLIKLLPETKFVNSIHERFTTAAKPVKILADIADHFGYAYEDEAARKAKMQRNIPLLLERMKKEGKKSPLVYMELYDCYCDIDIKKAADYLDQGISAALENQNPVAVTLYSKKIFYLCSENKLDEAWQLSEEYFSLPSKIRPHKLSTDSEILGLRGYILYRKKAFSEAINEYTRFFDLFLEYKSGKLRTTDVHIAPFSIASDARLPNIMLEYADACIVCNRFEQLKKYDTLVSISEYFGKDGYPIRINQEIELYDRYDFDGFDEFYRSLDITGKKEAEKNIVKKIFTEDQKERYIHILSLFDSNDGRIPLLSSIFRIHFIENASSENNIIEYAEKYGADDRNTLIEIMISEGHDFTRLLTNVKSIELSFSDIAGMVNALGNYNADIITSKEGIAAAVLFIRSLVPFAHRSGCDVMKLFVLYGQLGMKYYSLFPDDEIHTDIYSAILANNIYTFYLRNDYKNCISSMRELLKILPEFKCIIIRLNNIIKAKMG